MAFYQPKSRRIPEATDKRGEKIFEPKTHCEIALPSKRSGAFATSCLVARWPNSRSSCSSRVRFLEFLDVVGKETNPVYWRITLHETKAAAISAGGAFKDVM